MGIKPRSPGQTAVSISVEQDLLAQIDARATALGLTRSKYLAMLAEQDIANRGPLILMEKNEPPPAPTSKPGPVKYTLSRKPQNVGIKPTPRRKLHES